MKQPVYKQIVRIFLERRDEKVDDPTKNEY
jgi:hypothetical protein